MNGDIRPNISWWLVMVIPQSNRFDIFIRLSEEISQAIDCHMAQPWHNPWHSLVRQAAPSTQMANLES